jgi:hypothetical protein
MARTYSEDTMAADALPLLRKVERANLPEPERQMLRFQVIRAGSKLAAIDVALNSAEPTDRELRDQRTAAARLSGHEDGRAPRLARPFPPRGDARH